MRYVSIFFGNRTRALFSIFVLMILAVLAWASLMRIDKSVILEGELIPMGRPLVVQNEVQGRILQILARVGEKVELGQPLFVLEATDDLATLEESQSRVIQLMIEEARYQAELELRLSFSTHSDWSPSAIRDQELALFASIAEFRASLDELDQEIENVSAQEKSLEALLPGIQSKINLAKARLAMLSDLRDAKFEGDLAVMEAEQDLSDSRAQLLESQGRLTEIRGQKQKLERSKKLAFSSFKREASAAFLRVRQELEIERVKLKAYRERLGRYTFQSPASGLLSKVNVFNAGEVVEYGSTLAELIPNGVPISFYGRAPIASISDLSPGQNARITLMNMDTRRVAPLDAVLVHVDPDASESEEHGRYFGVDIEIVERADVEIVPGVTGTAYVYLGDRTVIEYFIEPILNALDSALVEK